MLRYYQGDELPYWQPTVVVNGDTYDFSSGWTFAVGIAATPDATPVLTKTNNITGNSSGTVTVAWATTDLTMAPGMYTAQLTGTRSSDSAQFTITDDLQIFERLA